MADRYLTLFAGLHYLFFPTIFSIPNFLLLVIFIRDHEYRKLSSTKILMSTCIVELLCANLAAFGGAFTLFGEPPLLCNRVIGAVIMMCAPTFHSLILVLAINRLVVMIPIRQLDIIVNGIFLKLIIAWCWLEGFAILALFLHSDCRFVYRVEKLSWVPEGSLAYVGRYLGLLSVLKLSIAFILYLIILLRIRCRKVNIKSEIELRVLVQSVIVTMAPALDMAFYYYVNSFLPHPTTLDHILSICSWMLVLTINPYVYFAVNPTIRAKYKILAQSMFGCKSETRSINRTNTGQHRLFSSR